MTHILKSFSSDQSSISDSNNNSNSNEIKDSLSHDHDHDHTNNLDLICNLCIPQRNFSNSDALFQHTRAKHSTSSSSSSQLSIPPITSQIITPPPSSSTSMLGHIIYQVKKVLQRNGIFYLSLADDQPINWKL